MALGKKNALGNHTVLVRPVRTAEKNLGILLYDTGVTYFNLAFYLGELSLHSKIVVYLEGVNQTAFFTSILN